jgi:hypothetical protein
VTIYPKLLPLQLAGDPSNPITTSLSVSFVDAEAKGE